MGTNKKTSGFTLIEVMVVITIMGVLAMVGVPKLYGVIERSRENIDVLKLYYLRDALNRALVENEDALTQSPYIAEANESDQASRKKNLSDKLASNTGMALFVLELKNGVAVNVQGKHGSANNNFNMCELIGNSGVWYNALREAGFEGVADIVGTRLDIDADPNMTVNNYYKDFDASGASYSAKKDASNNWRTTPNKQMFISRAMNEGKTSANYRLTMSFQWTGGKASSRSVEVALLPNGKQMRDNKGEGSAFRTDHGVCFSTYGRAGCKNYRY